MCMGSAVAQTSCTECSIEPSVEHSIKLPTKHWIDCQSNLHKFGLAGGTELCVDRLECIEQEVDTLLAAALEVVQQSVALDRRRHDRIVHLQRGGTSGALSLLLGQRY